MVIDQNDRMFPYSGLGATRGPVSQPPGPVRLPQMEPTKGLLPKRTVKSRRKGYEQRKPSGLAIPPDYPMTLGPSFLLGHGGSQVGRGSSFSSPRVRTAPALGMPDDEQFFYGGRLVPPDAYDFAEGGEVEYGGDEGLSDEEKRQREAAAIANAGDVPVPAPAPQPPAPTGPIFGPPVPTYQENVQAIAQQMTPAQLQGAANELAQSGYYDTVVPVIRDIQSAIAGRNEAGAYPVPAQPTRQQTMERLAAQLGGGTGVGNVVRGAISNVATETVLPALQRTIVGGSPVGGQLAGLPGATTYEQGTKAELPYAVAAREQAGAIGEKVGEPVGLGGVTRFIAQAPFVTNVGDLALVAGTAGMAKTPFEGITGVPWVNPVKGVRDATAGVREALTGRGLPTAAVEPQQVYRLAVREGALAPVPAANELAASLGSMRIANPDLARVLQPGEALRPGEQLMFHGGNLSGPIRPDTFVTPSERTAESIARFNERAATLPRPGIREALAERATRGLGLTPSPDVAPAGVRSIASEIQMPGVRGGASQQEPLASILRRADAGDPKVTAAYLRSVADDRGIDLAGATKKSDVLAALRGAETPAGGGTPGSLPGPEAVAGPVAATPPPASATPTRELWDDFVSENVPNPGALPVNDLDKYNISQVYALSDPPNPPVAGLQGNEIRTRLYNAGLDSNGTAPQLRARYTEATERGIKLPYEEVPSEMPDMRDLGLAGRTPQSPFNAPDPEIARQGRLAGASGRIDSYIDQARQAERAAQQVPAPSDVRALSADDALAESRRLGNVMDEEAFAKGTKLTRDIELEKLQRAADAENERMIEAALGAEGRATSAVRTQNAELGLVQGPGGAADNLTPAQREFLGSQNGLDAAAQRGGGRGWADPTQRPAGSGGAAVASRYGQTDLAGAAKSVNIFGKLFAAAREVSYIPFGGDAGSLLRNVGISTVNVTNAAQTKNIIAYMARSTTDAGNNLAVRELKDRLLNDVDNVLSGRFGKPIHIDLNLAGWGDKVQMVDREVLTSQGLGRLPVLGMPWNVTGRMNTMGINATRVEELTRFVKNHPNATPIEVQSAANMYERISGRGTLINKGIDEKFANAAGSLFTSLRMPLGIVEGTGYLLPFHRLSDGTWQVGGSVWQEAMREHAGFFATTFGIMGLAASAGMAVDWAKGEISDGPLHIPLWGGYAPIFNMVRQVVEGEKNGVPTPAILPRQDENGVYRGGAVAEYVRNRLSPLLGAGFTAARATGLDEKLGAENELNYLRPEYWDKGMFGRAGLDRAAAMLLPLWVQEVVEAWRVAEETNTNPITNAIITAATGFFGLNTSNYGGTAERERTRERNDVIFDMDRNKVFGPDLAPLIGKNDAYAQLGSREKELVNAQLDPAELQRLRDEAIKSGNKGEAVLQQREELKTSYRPAFDKLDAALKDGTMTPFQVRTAATALERHMYDSVDKIKYPEREDSGSYKPSRIQQAETGYRALYDKVPKLEDGKTDYDTLRALQLSYLTAVAKASGPEFAGRLAFNVLPRVGPNDSAIQQFYDQPEMKAAVSAYNADGVNKTAYRVDNPDANALLYAGGYVRTLDTPDAVEAYKSYSKGEPEINFTVGFRQEGFVSYANLGGGPLGDQVRTYQSLPSGEGEYERPDYLRAHPDLNVLLWQTGHTSKVYSLAAWNKVASK